MLKNVRIEMTGPGFGKVFIDGEEIHGVRETRVELGVNKPNTVHLTLLAKTVDFEGLAEVSTFASAAQEFEKFERGDAPAETVRLLGEAARLELEPGDALVLSVPRAISQEMVRRLESMLAEKFPGRLVVVLGDDLKLGALGGAVPVATK